MAKVKKFNKNTGKEEVVKQTPEEMAVEQRQEEKGNAFIQEREKLIHQIDPGNVAPKRAGEEALRLISEREEAKREAGVSNVQVPAAEAAKRQQKISELVQPEAAIPKEKGLVQKGTEMLLAPSTALGNIATAGLEKATGKEFGRTTTEEFAATKSGKAIAGAELLTGAALLGAGAAEIVPFAVPVASKIAVTKAASSASWLSVQKLLVGAGIAAIPETLSAKINLNTKSISANNAEILEAVKQQGKSASQAISELRENQRILLQQEQTAKILSFITPSDWVISGFDSEVKIKNALEDVNTKITIIENLMQVGTIPII